MKNSKSYATTQATAEEIALLNKHKKKSQLKETWRRLKKNKGAVAGLVIIFAVLLISVFSDVLFDYKMDVIMPNPKAILQHPSSEHLFGTDELGRDVFSRVVYGTKYSMQIAVFSTAISLTIGGMIGAYSGYVGGKLDSFLMRIMDIFLAIPNMLLALAIVASLGPSIYNLIVAIAISDIPRFARIVRSSVLSIKDIDYIEASRASGATTSTIIFREILPNCIAPIMVQMTMVMAAAIILSAGLSFIGLGVKPPAPEWGAMLSSGREYIRSHQYLVLFPGLAIVITVLAFNLLGDGLRDALDPRLKQ